ncbi:MAG: YIP1 family protein [Thermoanaerobaculia bacterium]
MESSAWGRLVGVLISPVKTFESIAAKPTWLVALLVLLAVQIGISAVATPKIDMEREVRSRIEASGQEIPEEQIRQQVTMGEKFRWVGLGIQAVAGPIVYFVMGLVFWLLLRFVGDSELKFGESMAALTHGFMPWVVAGLLGLPLLLGRDSVTSTELRSGLLSSNLGAFAPEDASPVLKALLGSVDVFSLWTLALLLIGYAAVARTKRATVAWVVVGLWVLYVAGKVGLTALFS